MFLQGLCCLLAVHCCLQIGSCYIEKQRSLRSVDLSSSHTLIQDTRLAKDIVPLSYNLNLNPSLSDNIFDGNIRINMTWIRDAKRIILHAHSNLNIKESNILLNCLHNTGEENVLVKRVDRMLKKSLLTLVLNHTIKQNSICELQLKFDGQIWENTDGIFKGSYLDESNITQYYIATNLKPNNARRVFPCFDDPEFKVPFLVSISRPSNFFILFNTPLARSEDLKNDTFLDVFEETPPMSTFSIGFAIVGAHNVQKIHKCLDSNSKINVWTTPESMEKIETLNCKILKIFEYMEKYFNSSLPLSKIDILAVPEFSLVRPIDNWGLIVFRESELLKNSTSAIAQEIITQWLSSFITPEWWNDMPINKALASFLAAETALKLDDGSEYAGKYPMTILYSVYYEFSKRYPNSRITGMKHETSSYKTELLLRMLNFTLGAETFKKSVQNLIKQHRNSTFRGSDFWNALTNQGKEDGILNEKYSILNIVSSWLEMDRLPMVKITRDYDKKTAKVQQKLYLRERPHDVPDREKMLWWIPLVLIKQNEVNSFNTTPYVWMEKQMNIDITNLPDKDEFIIVNPEEIGPFPVNYDERNWNLLAEFLQTEHRENVPMYTRAKLLHDAWNLAYAGDLDFGTAFNMTLFMMHERNHVVWNPVFTFIDHVGRHIDNSHVHVQFEEYVKHLLSPLYEELGPYSQDEENWKTNLRTLAKTFLCRCGYQPCIEEAQKTYKLWVENVIVEKEISIPKDVICPIFKWGTFEEWDFAFQRVLHYPLTAVKSERTFLLKMLAKCPAQTSTITHLLNITFLSINVTFPDNDVILILRALTEGSNGYQTLFEFLLENWTFLRERFSSKTNIWDTLIRAATGHFNTQSDYEQVKALYERKSGEFGSADHIIARSLKNIKEEVAWTNENIPIIENWLNNFLAKVKN